MVNQTSRVRLDDMTVRACLSGVSVMVLTS